MSYFDGAYRDYEGQNPPAKLDHYLDVIAARSPSSSQRILDLGCGRGLFLERASSRFPCWVLSGMDPDPDGVAATQKRVVCGTICLGTAEAIPFPADSFDIVSAWDVLEHVPRLDAALSEIKRCLRPGGVLAVVVPVYDGITGPVIRRLDRDPTHVHKQSRGFWVDLLGEHFDDLEWHGIHRFLITRSMYLHRPTARLRRATAAILATATNR